jgi:hypothetical protein
VAALLVDTPHTDLEADRHRAVIAIGDVGADVEVDVAAPGEGAKFQKRIHTRLTVPTVA